MTRSPKRTRNQSARLVDRNPKHESFSRIFRRAVSGAAARVSLPPTGSASGGWLVGGREDKAKALEEVVRRLEEVKADPLLLGELDFEDARVDGYVTMALSAARSALALTAKHNGPEDAR